MTDTDSATLATAIRRYLDGELTAEALRDELAEREAALRVAPEPATALSRAVATAALVIMEQQEGVRPPADVRSALAAVARSLEDGPRVRPRPLTGVPPRPKGKRRSRRS